jgi:hypothetical protein
MLEEALVRSIELAQGCGHTWSKAQCLQNGGCKGSPQQVEAFSSVMRHAHPRVLLQQRFLQVKGAS